MDEPQESGQQARLRSHPSGRFAGERHAFNVGEVLTALRAEAHPAERGHRQMTIFHRAPVTLVVFAFEPGGELADHAAHGLVTIHVLEGRLAVQADARDHELRAGSLLVLNPDVRHHVRALDASAMLLTVHLESENDISGCSKVPHEVRRPEIAEGRQDTRSIEMQPSRHDAGVRLVREFAAAVAS